MIEDIGDDYSISFRDEATGDAGEVGSDSENVKDENDRRRGRSLRIRQEQLGAH